MRGYSTDLSALLKKGLRPDARIGRNTPYCTELVNMKVGDNGLEPIVLPTNLTLPLDVYVIWPFPQLLLTSAGSLLFTTTKVYQSAPGSKSEAPVFTQIATLGVTAYSQFHLADFGAFLIAVSPFPQTSGVQLIRSFDAASGTWKWTSPAVSASPYPANTVANFRQTLIRGLDDEVMWSPAGGLESMSPEQTGDLDYRYIDKTSNRSGSAPTTPISLTRVGSGAPWIMKSMSSFSGEFTKMAAGRESAIAVAEGGIVKGWGRNVYGECGQGNNNPCRYPATVKGVGGIGSLTGIIGVGMAFYTSFALASDGFVYAWGANGGGQLGQNNTTVSYTPVKMKDAAGTGFLSNIVKIAAGGAGNIPGFVLALDSTGFVWACGGGAQGQLGQGPADLLAHSLPVKVKDAPGTGFLTNVVNIWAGGYGSCFALDSSGRFWSWGYNDDGQLAIGVAGADQSLPVQTKWSAVLTMTDVVDIVTNGDGHNHTLFRHQDGTVWAAGKNSSYQLGDGTNTDRLYPVQVKGPLGVSVLTEIKSIGATETSSYAISLAGEVWAWGGNVAAQLGIGTYITTYYPTRVMGVAGIGYISGVAAVVGGTWYAEYFLLDNGMILSTGYDVTATYYPAVTSTYPIYVDDLSGSYTIFWSSAARFNKVLRILPMEPANAFIVYTSDGIYAYINKTQPTPTFGRVDVARHIGIPGWHCAQSNSEGTLHICIDHYGDIWSVDGKLQAKKLGYKEYIKPLMAACPGTQEWYPRLIILYSKKQEAFFITNGTTCYMLSNKGLSQVGYCPTSLASWHDIGELV